MHAYEKALYLDELTDEAIDVIAEHLPKKIVAAVVRADLLARRRLQRCRRRRHRVRRQPRARLRLQHLRGRARPRTAVEAERAWVRDSGGAAPHARGVGSYVNFMAEVDEDRVRAAYGATKYERLAADQGRSTTPTTSSTSTPTSNPPDAPE